MYDPLTSTYSFACPSGRDARVPLSAFRSLERLPAASHPAVYRVLFECRCGSEHVGLVSHDDLDWAPLGTVSEVTFRNLLTSHDDPLAAELADLAASRIRAGEWPWSFFCCLEGRARPMTPSALAVIAPGESSFAVAVLCPVCAAVSVNLVSQEHVDLPFWNDRSIGVVEHVFRRDAVRAIEEFRAELHSVRFDERRLDLEL
ncbi:MAG: hypothetical protein M3364_03685 [Actinomycetota bacterium]|nr:hypothetical protein [Actinomycetota bacterium]